jgi:hypothetical protein
VRRPSGPASKKTLIGGPRPEARVAKIKMREPERIVMNCLKFYGSPVISDVKFDIKNPAMHSNPMADMLTGRVSQTATGDHGPEKENSHPIFPPTIPTHSRRRFFRRGSVVVGARTGNLRPPQPAADGGLTFPARNSGGRRSPSPYDSPTRAIFPSFGLYLI